MVHENVTVTPYGWTLLGTGNATFGLDYMRIDGDVSSLQRGDTILVASETMMVAELVTSM